MNTFNNCILLVVFNYSNCTANKDFIKKIYEKHFKKIIFYSDYPITKDNEINFLKIERGFFTHQIFNEFYKKYKTLIDESDGLFYTMDDNIINVNILNLFDNSKIIYYYSEVYTLDSHFFKLWGQNHVWYNNVWCYWNCGKQAINNLMNDSEFKTYNIDKFSGNFSDFFYLPKKYLNDKLFKLFELFGKYNVFLELAIPSVIHNIETDKLQYNIFKSEILWTDRHKFFNKDHVYNSLNKKNLFLHPIKFNQNPNSKLWLDDYFNKKIRNTKCIIITTINPPTKQILHYADILDWDLIIVGDSKTNDELYKDINCTYLGLKEQQELFPSIYEKIPLKSYTRKMFGYIYAIKHKYVTIYDTDDDNKYTEILNSYENNFIIHENIDFPGYDIKSVDISGFNHNEINKEMKKIISICPSNFTFDKRSNKLWLKDDKLGVSIKATPHKDCISGIFREVKTSNTQGFVNLYKNYSDANIWPRGIPPKHSSIDIVPELSDELPKINEKVLEVSIIQGLVNNDPDVDAYYRININNKSFTFEKDPGYDIVLNKNSVCPFNTQNTFWTDPSMFYAMYLPVTVTFRYTDILHGFVALYQLWKNNKTIKFTFPTAFQERNEHDLQKDYESEVSMYETAEQVISLLNQNKDATIQEVYSILADNKIVDKSELDVLNEWMKLIGSFV